MQISLTVREKLFDPKFFRQFQPKLALSETAESQSKHAGQQLLMLMYIGQAIEQSAVKVPDFHTANQGLSPTGTQFKVIGGIR